ncbi:hypothetical protein QFC22_000012 [Naganishia vaughanmartiniae]|uniref:Uncharacterized protein n=1 Tax=Naganishia vaughanmartiniae TaxID=1424756 RepID=A0ACC2XNN4_9TREE|nr:hypothetical protein QFC22_000012 [Naganishia vaughanmartiniae]
MHAITSRNSTPSRSPHHSPSHQPLHANPVTIPPPQTTDLPHANALRYKHLYGFPQTSALPNEQGSEVSPRRESVTTDGSDAEYVEYVVENPGASGSPTISDSTIRTRSTNTSSLGADHANLASSASPTAWLSSSSFASSSLSPSTSGVAAVFPLSSAVRQGGMVELESVISEKVVNVEDVSRVAGNDDLDLETLSDGACTPRQEASNNVYQGTSPRTRTIQHSSTRIPFNNLRTTSSSSSSSDVTPEEDEFRCSTCHHAGICADLIMQDPTFKCGNTMTTTSVTGLRERRGEREGSRRGVEKTPWTGQRIRDVIEPAVVGGDGARLRVLQGGVDYVRYDEEGGDTERKVADMEDLGRAMRGTSLASPAHQYDFATSPTVRTSSSSRNPPRPALSSTLSGRTQRRSWNDIRVEYPAASLNTHEPHEDTLPPEPDSTETTGVDSSDEAVMTPSFPTFTQLANDGTSTLDESLKNAASSRSRSRNKHIPPASALWAIENVVAAVLGTSEGEERYDHADELYGVDVVERGRARLR